MAAPDTFEFTDFADQIAGAPREELSSRVDQELDRVRRLVVREPSWKFKQKVYARRLERLLEYLKTGDLAADLTPSEAAAYGKLHLGGPPPRSKAAAAAATPPAEREMPAGAERRESRRIQMRTMVRIRRADNPEAEVLQPLNVSRGGMGFRSDVSYQLHETVWVTMHYNPRGAGDGDMERRSIIVRAAPEPSSAVVSYGVRFID